MSGHSKWSTIKRKKGAADAKRGKIFSMISKEITVAARQSGGDPGFNPRLRTVLLKAKQANMPADNIDRAIKKGTGELPGVSYDEVTYEGYAPGGVALLVDVLTDNKNRSAAEVRAIFTKNQGNLAGANAVKHLFQYRGQIIVAAETADEERVMEIALENGAEDMTRSGDTYEIVTDPADFEKVHKTLEDNEIKTEQAEVVWLPINAVPVTDEQTAQQILRLVEALEDNEDVQAVHANFDIADEIMDKLTAATTA